MNAITNPFTYDVGLARIDDLLRDAANHRLAREASQGSATNPRRISATPKRKENDMSAPFIFITEHTVKSGRLNDLERLTDEFVEFVEANEPHLLAINAYLNDDRDRFTLVQIHADAESMESHLQVAGDRIHQALDVVDNDSVTVFGTPGRITRRLLDQIWAAGVRVRVNSSQLGGFHRLTAD
jgi:quinol monooxygenase YgiN